MIKNINKKSVQSKKNQPSAGLTQASPTKAKPSGHWQYELIQAEQFTHWIVLSQGNPGLATENEYKLKPEKQREREKQKSRRLNKVWDSSVVGIIEGMVGSVKGVGDVVGIEVDDVRA